jgi:GR25 family glycosyltransferase involved in LPS biosynthesis
MSSDINIFSIPLYYISFKKNEQLEKELRDVGFTNINHFEAVNGKKLNLDKIIKNNIISVRTYNDLLLGRNEHSGISSLGAIGCSLSHYYLWRKCVNENLSYITIVEDDIKLKNLSERDIENIKNVIKKDKGLFISPFSDPTNDSVYTFTGTHFYIASNNACKELIKYMFPIDVQLDAYMAHLKTLGYINLEGYHIFGQKVHMSSIQDICVKCILPKHSLFYLVWLIFVILLIYLSIRYFSKYKTCVKTCKVK